MAFCAHCGVEGTGDFCTACGKPRAQQVIAGEDPRVVRARVIQHMKQTQRHGVPALLSLFIPGLGQLVKGQILTGLIVMVAAAFFGLLCFVGIGVILLPIFWVVQVYDAYAKPDAALMREIKSLTGT